MGGLAVFAFIYLLRGRYAIIDRFSDPLSMLFLAIAWFLQIVVNGLATYLRAHKQEPLVLPSVLSAVYVTADDVPVRQVFRPRVFLSRMALRLRLGRPVGFWIFAKKRDVADYMTSAAHPYLLTIAVPTYNRASYLDICLPRSAPSSKATERGGASRLGQLLVGCDTGKWWQSTSP